jgi:predicted dehydrogenase
MVHENFRWQTPIQAVKKVLESGAIGQPFWGRFSFRSGYDVFSGQPYLAKASASSSRISASIRSISPATFSAM